MEIDISNDDSVTESYDCNCRPDCTLKLGRISVESEQDGFCVLVLGKTRIKMTDEQEDLLRCYYENT